MIYFDNAATTFPKPKFVLDSVANAIKFYGGNPGHGGHSIAMNTAQKVYETREKIAAFFNGDVENVIFTQNCTMATNIAIKGIVNNGDHVIISDLEHNAVYRPINKLTTDGIISYDVATVFDDDEKTLSEFKSKILSNTRAIVCTHSSNVTGKVLPIRMLGKLCHEKNIIFIVDSAQSAGVLPINMKEDSIDILCLAGHKGLYGITGTGLLIVNTSVNIKTFIEGGTGSRSTDILMPENYPDRLEAGTINTVGILSIGAGIDVIKNISREKIYTHEITICKYVFDELSKIRNIKLYQNSIQKSKNTPIVSFNIANKNSEEIAGILNNKGFAVRAGLHCSPLAHKKCGTLSTGIVRFSPSFMNKSSSVEAFVKIIKNISENS